MVFFVQSTRICFSIWIWLRWALADASLQCGEHFRLFAPIFEHRTRQTVYNQTQKTFRSKSSINGSISSKCSGLGCRPKIEWTFFGSNSAEGRFAISNIGFPHSARIRFDSNVFHSLSFPFIVISTFPHQIKCSHLISWQLTGKCLMFEDIFRYRDLLDTNY